MKKNITAFLFLLLFITESMIAQNSIDTVKYSLSYRTENYKSLNNAISLTNGKVWFDEDSLAVVLPFSFSLLGGQWIVFARQQEEN